MRLTLRQLQIFRAVVRSGSTATAAQSMPLSQSATSAAVNELERTLNARLFDRVGKRLLLNENGRALWPMALALLDGAQHIESAFGAGDEALVVDLHLFASTTVGNYILPPLLASFRAAIPAARLELRIGNTRDVISAVRDFGADLGLIEGPCYEPGIVVVPWLQDELVIVASPAHPLAKAAESRRLTAQQLKQAQWLLREPGSGTRDSVEQVLLPHLVNIHSVMTLGSTEAIKNSAAEGLGLSCLSRCVVQEPVATQRLCVLPTRLPRLTRRFTLVHHEKKLLSGALHRFMAHCQANGTSAAS